MKITNKVEFIKEIKRAFFEFSSLIDSLPTEIKYKDIIPNKRDKNVRDFCAQIVGWQNLLIKWYKEGSDDQLPDIPAKGYTWGIADALSMKMWQRYQKSSLDELFLYCRALYEEVLTIIEKYNDEELFNKKAFRWTQNKTVFYYFNRFTIEIYLEKTKLIKKALKKHKIELSINPYVEEIITDEMVTTDEKEKIADEKIEDVKEQEEVKEEVLVSDIVEEIEIADENSDTNEVIKE